MEGSLQSTGKVIIIIDYNMKAVGSDRKPMIMFAIWQEYGWKCGWRPVESRQGMI
jgi:hypothetical protein